MTSPQEDVTLEGALLTFYPDLKLSPRDFEDMQKKWKKKSKGRLAVSRKEARSCLSASIKKLVEKRRNTEIYRNIGAMSYLVERLHRIQQAHQENNEIMDNLDALKLRKYRIDFSAYTAPIDKELSLAESCDQSEEERPTKRRRVVEPEVKVVDDASS